MENTSLYHRLLLSVPARFSPSFPPCTSLLAVFFPWLFLFRLLFLAEAISLSLSPSYRVILFLLLLFSFSSSEFVYLCTERARRVETLSNDHYLRRSDK